MEKRQMNVNVSRDDEDKVIRMMTEIGFDNRSAFVRWLIRQEWERRKAEALVTTTRVAQK